MESETISTNFLYYVTLKFICLSYSVNEPFTHAWVSNMYWLVGKYWFTEVYRVSKCWHQKLFFCQYHQPSHRERKSLRLGKLLRAWWQMQGFQILMLAWKLKFYNFQKLPSVAVLKKQAHSLIFRLPNTQDWIIIVCMTVILSSKNGTQWKCG